MNERLLSDAIAWTRQNMAISAGHDWGHIERVLHNATELAQAEGADILVAQLAAVMHDVVNLEKDHPERKKASVMSAERASQWLQGKLQQPRIDGVYEAIKCHSYSAGFTPQGLEAKVVSDADNLDALGAIGIARTFECGGAMGTATMSAQDPFCTHRQPDDGRYTVDHFFAKLLRLEERFYTDSGRQAAKQRLDYMRAFLAQLDAEIPSDAPP